MKLDQRLILILALFSAMTSKLQAEPLTLQLDLGVRNVQFAGINWAQGHGWFTEAGLDLEVRSWTPEYSNVASEVASNPGTIGSIESGLFLSAIAEGKPLGPCNLSFSCEPRLGNGRERRAYSCAIHDR